MNPFEKKYHYLRGTHCWFCDREIATSKHVYIRCGSPLMKTKEHIVPKSKIIYGYHRNYILSCGDCNQLKGKNDARQFAILLKGIIMDKKQTHSMKLLMPLMRIRAWKLFNKTSNLHKNYKTLRASGYIKSL